MSVLRDAVKDLDSSEQVSKEVKEALAMLVELSQEKANTAEGLIKLDLQTGKTTDDLTVPITKVMQSRSEYRAMTSTSSDIIGEISKSIGQIFSGNGKILEGISGIAETALKAIAGAGQGQESETRYYSVVTEYPAIVRFDFYFWGRNTTCESIMKKIETAFACVGYKSAVDISQLDYNTFLALYAPILKKAFGDDESKLKDMIKESKEVYDMFKCNSINSESDISRLSDMILTGSDDDFAKLSGKKVNTEKILTPKLTLLPQSPCGIF